MCCCAGWKVSANCAGTTGRSTASRGGAVSRATVAGRIPAARRRGRPGGGPGGRGGLAEEPVPEPGPGETLVRVTAVGICGSDLHWWGEAEIGDASISRPLVLGHEAAGVIESGPRRGTRVAIDPAVACGTCRPCRAGYRNLCARIRFA